MDLQKGCRRLAAWVLTLALTAAAGCRLKKAGFLLPASVICFIAEEVDYRGYAHAS